MAESHARGRAEKARTSIADARANALKLDWKTYTPPKPSFLGTRAFKSYDLAELARFIDWTPFFQAWELKGAYPRILKDDKYGEAARHLFDDAQAMTRVLNEVLAANETYAGDFGDKGKLPLPPGRRFAILTCMDARLDPAKFAGLKEGDAHVIRNAGGRASDDAIRSLVISYKLLGTREFFVVHHTDCGMLTQSKYGSARFRL